MRRSWRARSRIRSMGVPSINNGNSHGLKAFHPFPLRHEMGRAEWRRCHGRTRPSPGERGAEVGKVCSSTRVRAPVRARPLRGREWIRREVRMPMCPPRRRRTDQLSQSGCCRTAQIWFHAKARRREACHGLGSISQQVRRFCRVSKATAKWSGRIRRNVDKRAECRRSARDLPRPRWAVAREGVGQPPAFRRFGMLGSGPTPTLAQPSHQLRSALAYWAHSTEPSGGSGWPVPAPSAGRSGDQNKREVLTAARHSKWRGRVCSSNSGFFTGPAGFWTRRRTRSAGAMA